MDRPQIRKRIYRELAAMLERDLASDAPWVIDLCAADWGGDISKVTDAARRRVLTEGRTLVAQLQRKSEGSDVP
jgi:hypothetical protein